MPRTFTLLSACILAFAGLSVAAPADQTSSIQLKNSVAAGSANNYFEKRGKKHRKNRKHKKTKTTTVAPTPTATAGTPDATNSGDYTGTATWFRPASEGGPIGACGPEEDEESLIVALNAPQYGNMDRVSSWCGKKVIITGPAGTATATINDACPECKHGDLDLTPILFKKIVGDMDIGVGKISWSLI